MSKRPSTTDQPDTESADAGDAFLSRWARRKAAARTGGDPDAAADEASLEARELASAAPSNADAPTAGEDEQDADESRDGRDRAKQDARAERAKQDARPPELTDEDMPPVSSIDENTDMSGFFSPKVTQAVKKAALKKFFHSPIFNIVDGLDDYDDDFRNFEALGDIITSDMRGQMEREAERAREAAANHEPDRGSPDVGTQAADKADEQDTGHEPEEIAEDSSTPEQLAAAEPETRDPSPRARARARSDQGARHQALGGPRKAAPQGRRRRAPMSAVKSAGLSVTELEQRLGCRLPEQSADGQARSAALMADSWDDRTPTSLVAYTSAGSVAIIANREVGEELVTRLGETLKCTLLIPRVDDASQPGAIADAAGGSGEGGSTRSIYAALAGVSGYLGQFTVKGRVGGEVVDIAPSLLTAHKPFDIVLDLGEPAQLECEMLPPGYFAPGTDGDALERALAEIPELVGEFDKPRYFNYNPDICAHGASGIRACTRCIDACPTLAISSAGECIEVDPYLCQGGGGCATACPSGAISYAFPLAGDLLASLRRVLADYYQSGGLAAQVLFYDGDSGREWLRQHAEVLPENIIPCEVEEIGALGMDVWLCVLAYGAVAVTMLCMPGTPPSVRRELEAQRLFAAAILEGMGHDPHRIRLQEASDEAALMSALGGAATGQALEAATFQPQNEKRTNIRLAVEHLYEQAPAAGRDGAATRRGALRRVTGKRQNLHLVHGLRIGMSGVGPQRRRQRAEVEFHRVELCPVRPVRERLSRGCHPAAHALRLRSPAAPRHPGPQRGQAL